MKKAIKPTLLSAAAALLVLINIQYSQAHQWWKWHWDKSRLGVAIWNCVGEGNSARWDWDSNTDLSLPLRSTHTDISGDCNNYGNTGWFGLARIENSSFDFWHCFAWCRIEHAHALVNLYYSTVSTSWNRRRGVYCQEFGHSFGLDHTTTSDCMRSSAFVTTGPHNWADINAMY